MVEFGSGKGGADELGVSVVDPTPAGPVPDGAALPAVELGSGYGTEIDRPDEAEGKPTVPALPVANGVVAFGSGYGALLNGTLGPVPVPPTPELKGIGGAVGPPVAVWFVRAYGGVVVTVA
jgi:hypothetical protein